MFLSQSPERFGIFGVASVSPRVAIGNPFENINYILEELKRPELENSRFIVFPELCITGYTCGDLFLQDSLLNAAQQALLQLAAALEYDRRLIAVGLPLSKEGQLFNCAAVIANGEIQGIVPKTHIPNYQEFYEKRWFASGEGIRNTEVEIAGVIKAKFGTDLIFEFKGVKVGIEICEDLWVPTPPSSVLCLAGAELILNLSATDENIGKYDYIKSLLASQSGRCRCAYAYASAGIGESSTDLAFTGINVIAFDGKIAGESGRFSSDSKYAAASVDIGKLRHDRRKYSSFYDTALHSQPFCFISCDSVVDQKTALYPTIVSESFPFIPTHDKDRDKVCREIVEIQSWGLAQRLRSTGCKNLVVGISGGLDSTLALMVAHQTFRNLDLDPKGIVGVTMPALATSSRTHDNAHKLMELLGITALEIPIGDAVDLHFRQIGHDPEVFDAVYENSQARERTQILMDLANKYSGMVLGTGDMSELALGWCTYNGDHMSMYNVNGGVPKTLVKYIVKWFADNSPSEELKKVLFDIIDTPISPELVPSNSKEEIAQKTEDLVGPYELHDFFLFNVLRNGFSPQKIMFLAANAFAGKYSEALMKHWLIVFYRRFFSQQFKRSCMPDGPKIGSVCLSPRGDWRMPSDASAALWLKEAENLDTE